MCREDDSLVLRCRAGDRDAFRELVERYQRRVYGIALSMLQSADDAMDATQDAFARAYSHLPRFRGASSFYTWLYRITVNLCLDHLRRAARTEPLDADADEPMERPTSGWLDEWSTSAGLDPDAALQSKQLRQTLARALNGISATHRAVLIMREVEELSYSEIAEVLGCSPGTVMSRLYYARSKLRAALLEPAGAEVRLPPRSFSGADAGPCLPAREPLEIADVRAGPGLRLGPGRGDRTNSAGRPQPLESAGSGGPAAGRAMSPRAGKR